MKKNSIKPILPALLLTACSSGIILETLHLKGHKTSAISTPPGASTLQKVTDADRNAVDKVANAEKHAVLKLSEVHDLINAAAKKHGVSPVLVKSIVATESNFQSDALSPKGAVGLMQMMPATGQDLGADVTIPEQNVDAGTRYLRFLIDKYKKSRYPLRNAIAAYNAGFGAVDKYRGVPPFRETRGYVTRVMSFMRQFANDPS